MSAVNIPQSTRPFHPPTSIRDISVPHAGGHCPSTEGYIVLKISVRSEIFILKRKLSPWLDRDSILAQDFEVLHGPMVNYALYGAGWGWILLAQKPIAPPGKCPVCQMARPALATS